MRHLNILLILLNLILITSTQRTPSSVFKNLKIVDDKRLSSSTNGGENFHNIEEEISLLNIVDNRLKKLDNLERVIQLMVRRIDRIDRSMEQKYNQIYHKIEANSITQKTRFDKIDEKLNYLSEKFDSVCEEDVEEIEEIFALPSIQRASRVLRPSSSSNNQDNNNNNLLFTSPQGVIKERRNGGIIAKAVNEMKETVSGMDRRLAFHINIVSENMGEMSALVNDVHSTILHQGLQHPNLTKSFLHHQLADYLSPLKEMQKRVETVEGIIHGTQNTLNDDLLPIAQKILTHSEREEKFLADIKNDIKEKTNNILEKLINPAFNDNLVLLDNDIIEDLDSSETIQSFVTTSSQHGDNYTNDDDDDESTKPKLLSVIFPSVENKPIIVNTSFTYHNGRNLNGVTGYSCADLYAKGLNESGVYYLQADGTTFWYLKVFCDMETSGGGWTVIQNRGDYGEPRENFNRDWEDYKYGFGDANQEFWIGNENIHMLTNSGEYELRIELEDFEDNQRHAIYREFRLGSEKESYRLEIGGYEGNAGDSLNDPWYGANFRPFSTYDKDSDRSSLNCASMLKGGWWWKSCGRGLNGLYISDPQDVGARQGIVWFRWRGWDYTLKKSKMMIRPKSFRNRSHSNLTSSSATIKE